MVRVARTGTKALWREGVVAERSQGLGLPGTPQWKCSVVGLVDTSFHQVLGIQRGTKRMDSPALWSFPILG